MSPLPSRPLVSCIMPTADRPLFLRQAIYYFLRLARSPDVRYELIIVDDGDLMAPQIDEPTIRTIRLKQRFPVGYKRNVACQEAAGDFIAHFDDDDWYPRERVVLQFKRLIAGGFDIIGSDRSYFWDFQRDRAWQYTGDNNHLISSSILYRKSVWEKNWFPVQQSGETASFLWSAKNQRAKIHNMQDIELSVGVLHGNNTGVSTPPASYFVNVDPSRVHKLIGDDKAFYDDLRDEAARARLAKEGRKIR